MTTKNAWVYSALLGEGSTWLAVAKFDNESTAVKWAEEHAKCQQTKTPVQVVRHIAQFNSIQT